MKTCPSEQVEGGKEGTRTPRISLPTAYCPRGTASLLDT